MSATDDLIARAKDYQGRFTHGSLPATPARRIAVVSCMDARINVFAILGLTEGDAHIIRNAGGVITDDAIRSLAISQHLLGTDEVLILQHTGCGMLTFSDEDLRQRMLRATGLTPSWPVETFDDLEANLLTSIARVKESPFILCKNVRGFIYDVSDGSVREVVS